MNAAVPAAVSPVAMRWPVLDADRTVRAWRADAPGYVPVPAVLDLLGAASDARYGTTPLLVDGGFEDVGAWLDQQPCERAGCVLPVLSAQQAREEIGPANAWVWAGRRFALRVTPDQPLPYPDWLALASFVLVPADAGAERLRSLVELLHAHTPAEVIADRALSPALVRQARAGGCDAWVGPAEVGGFSPTRTSALRLLALLADARTTRPVMVRAIETDALLVTHLLAWLGRAELHGYAEVSVATAVQLLGDERLRIWAAALALAGDVEAPVDALERALVRAALCAEAARLDAQGPDRDAAWLVGLLTELPLLTGLAMPQAVAAIGLGAALRAGLVDDGHPLGRLRVAAMAYQMGDWPTVRASGLAAVLADAYLGAVLAAGATITQWRSG